MTTRPSTLNCYDLKSQPSSGRFIVATRDAAILLINPQSQRQSGRFPTGRIARSASDIMAEVGSRHRAHLSPLYIGVGTMFRDFGMRISPGTAVTPDHRQDATESG